jgi:hypothetical protein
MAEWRNGRMAEWRDGGIAGNDGMAESQNGRLAEWRHGGMATYLLHLWYTLTTPTPFNLLLYRGYKDFFELNHILC